MPPRGRFVSPMVALVVTASFLIAATPAADAAVAGTIILAPKVSGPGLGSLSGKAIFVLELTGKSGDGVRELVDSLDDDDGEVTYAEEEKAKALFLDSVNSQGMTIQFDDSPMNTEPEYVSADGLVGFLEMKKKHSATLYARVALLPEPLTHSSTFTLDGELPSAAKGFITRAGTSLTLKVVAPDGWAIKHVSNLKLAGKCEATAKQGNSGEWSVTFERVITYPARCDAALVKKQPSLWKYPLSAIAHFPTSWECRHELSKELFKSCASWKYAEFAFSANPGCHGGLTGSPLHGGGFTTAEYEAWMKKCFKLLKKAYVDLLAANGIFSIKQT